MAWGVPGEPWRSVSPALGMPASAGTVTNPTVARDLPVAARGHRRDSAARHSDQPATPQSQKPAAADAAVTINNLLCGPRKRGAVTVFHDNGEHQPTDLAVRMEAGQVLVLANRAYSASPQDLDEQHPRAQHRDNEAPQDPASQPVEPAAGTNQQ